MWLGDTCHTYDRENIFAQLECGIGRNDAVLKNVTTHHFNVKYYPYVQTPANLDCLENFVPDSHKNMFYKSALFLNASASLSVVLFLSFYI